MIARRWRGWAAGPTQAEAYVAHFEAAVRPRLERTDGFLDATLERVQDDDGRTEIVVVTRWASMGAIRAFAGDAVVCRRGRGRGPHGALRLRPACSSHRARRRQGLRSPGADRHPVEAAAHTPWFNETLTSVNDALVRLGVIEGDFHQGCTVPRGVVHRTRAPRRTTILMVEAAGVMPVGD